MLMILYVQRHLCVLFMAQDERVCEAHCSWNMFRCALLFFVFLFKWLLFFFWGGEVKIDADD